MILTETKLRNKYPRQGFTIIELVIGIGILTIMLSGILASYSVLSRSVLVARERIVLATLASDYLETARNMPYNDVGTVNGNPAGVLPDATNPVVLNIEGKGYNVFYEVAYIDDSADGTILAGTDNAPNDYKQVKLSVRNLTDNVTTNFVTTISPQGLEGLNNAGALYLEVFDSNGQPVSGANVQIVNTDLNSDIILDRTSDSTGHVLEVGLPASVNGYQVTVTKSGYSSDQTYPISVANPNPTKPHATVVEGVVTSISFAIDIGADLTIRTVNQTCSAISGVGMNVRGSKLIGTGPDVLKYDQDLSSNGSGLLSLSDIEWDSYLPTLLSGEPYTIYGTSPVQQVLVLPGSDQTFTFVLGPSTANSFRVIVKDASTGSPLEGATVTLTDNSGLPQTYEGVTGGSAWQQSDWTAGPGQDVFVNQAQYYIQDGNVDDSSGVNGVRLAQVSGNFVSAGWLESSTFDTGGSSNFSTIAWEPISQHPATELKFQVATNNDGVTWNYVGPDGTSSTFYTIASTNLSSIHDSSRYVRYKAYFSTSDNGQTPVLADVKISYISGCSTPGQTIFTDLSSSSSFDLNVSLSGYQFYSDSNLTIDGNIVTEVLLSPN